MKTKHPRKKSGTRQEQNVKSVIQSVQLKGHSGSVLCLDHSNCHAGHNGGVDGSGDSVNRTFNSTLLSGSEDGTCRLWDLRTGIRASLCILCPASNCDSSSSSNLRDVLSVSFGPPWDFHHQQQQQLDDNSTNDDSVRRSPFAKDGYSVYTAIGNNVYGYDLRNISSPIITIPSTDFSFLNCPDEINQIALTSMPMRRSHIDQSMISGNYSNNNGKHSTYLLATADDSGVVRVTDCIQETTTTTTANDDSYHPKKEVNNYTHNETALVTSIAYCPNSRVGHQKGKKQQPVLLASGGTDCCIHLWDVGGASNDKTTTPKQQSIASPICSVSIPQQTQEQHSNQVCNPPMVHCLQWNRSGQLLAAGLGDGSVALLQHHQQHSNNNTSKSKLILSHRIDDAHSGTVASCLFPAWTSKHQVNINNSNNAITAHDRLMCTVGNDGCIVIWDLGVTVGGDKANNPASLFPLHDNDDNDVHGIDADGKGVIKKMSALKMSRNEVPIDDFIIDVPLTLFAFQHATKPNWMVNSGCNDTSMPQSLFVADTYHDITAYTIPIR